MVRLLVNGEPATLDLDPSTPLVTALRNDLGLRGVRAGCGIGECGACVVLVNGAATRSCQTPVSAVADADVTTPEGLSGGPVAHPVVEAFLREQAAQCGYCINGIVVALAGALARTGDEPDLRGALDEHLCRCGTHHRILRAVRRLAGHDVAPPASVVVAGDHAADPEPDEPLAVLLAAPRVEQWLRPLPDGRVEVLSGRVELGQGVRTALAQVVAAELDVALDRVEVRSAGTDTAVDEGYTAGSNSLQQGGAALARAAAAYRRLRDAGQPPEGPIEAGDRPRWCGGPIGEAATRDDLVDKLRGAPAYIHDLALPGMVHARALLPPTYGARPTSVDVGAAGQRPGVVSVLHDGGLVVVLAEREEQAIAAVAWLARTVRWAEPGPATAATDPASSPGEPVTVVDEDGVEAGLAGGRVVRASYSKPYEAHASIAPSCAVARAGPERLEVWTHSQGVFPLRRELAALLGEDESRLVVRHVDGPGCYGHNGADDAAGFAALAARAVPGRPVRFQFSVHDEFGWEPYGPPVRGDLAAALDADGRIVAWRHHIRTGPHMSRPRGSGDRLAVSWLRGGGPERPATGAMGGVRNAVPLYDLGARDIRAEYVRVALRTSSLRSLGAYANVFAIESFLDELAETAGADPLEFRLAHLRDERAREVLRLAASTAGWRRRVGPSGRDGRGRGLALARYDGRKAYVAQVVEVEVDTGRGDVAVRRVVTACDAGVVVNPDGLRHQLEGATLQSLSRALHEQVRPGTTGLDWTTYPVLRFAEVPDLETVLVDRPGSRPLGAGEAATPVTPAALANAVDDAVGIRVRDLPLTADRLRQRLGRMTDAESARVRV